MDSLYIELKDLRPPSRINHNNKKANQKTYMDYVKFRQELLLLSLSLEEFLFRNLGLLELHLIKLKDWFNLLVILEGFNPQFETNK